MNGEDVVELGELVLRGKSGVEGEGDHANKEYAVEESRRTGPLAGNHTLTIFKSVGVGVQDVAIAELVVRRAEEMGGVGVRIEEYDKHDG
jgi:ornithine cyclodeaminase